MGESSRRNYVVLLLAALADAMADQGHRSNIGAGIDAALAVYHQLG